MLLICFGLLILCSISFRDRKKKKTPSTYLIIIQENMYEQIPSDDLTWLPTLSKQYRFSPMKKNIVNDDFINDWILIFFFFFTILLACWTGQPTAILRVWPFDPEVVCSYTLLSTWLLACVQWRRPRGMAGRRPSYTYLYELLQHVYVFIQGGSAKRASFYNNYGKRFSLDSVLTFGKSRSTLT